MTRNLTFAICFALAATFVASAQDATDAAGDATAPVVPTGPSDLDHYKCYYVQSPFQQIPLLLQDQFDQAISSTFVEKIIDVRMVRFCNPVTKILNGTTTKMLRPADHLALYLLNPQQTIPRNVVISNQFGYQVLNLRNAEILAVPSGKSRTKPTAPIQIPTDLDHYKCYAASGREIGVRPTLIDQFHTEVVQVLQPFLFCNPVHKTHPIGTKPTPILRPLDHLACYAITPTPFQTTVFYNNQFVNQSAQAPSLAIAPADMLCVPSFKLRWHVVSTPPQPPAG